MRLLIITQAVDQENAALGFFHRWIEEFAQHAERVEVICLYEGVHALPSNVHIHSIGKEKGPRNSSIYIIRFYKLLYRLSGKYDRVFVHMNAEYIGLAGAYWRIPVALWYVHRSVTVRLRIAALFANLLLTTTPSSIGLRSKKVHVLGHGIDIKEFSEMPLPHIAASAPRLICVGRITPIKHLDTVLKAVAVLRKEGLDATLTIVGSTTLDSDRSYMRGLEKIVYAHSLEKAVTFRGMISHAQIPTIYAEHMISVNMAPPGLFDKVVLESLASGLVTVVANPAFREYLGMYSDALICAAEPAAIAKCISNLLKRPDLESMQMKLRAGVRRADIEHLTVAIMRQYEAIG